VLAQPLSPALRRVSATALSATLLPRTGKGVGLVILPSDPDALVEKLSLRMASYIAENTGVADEVIAVCDELLRQGLLGKESYKAIMTQLVYLNEFRTSCAFSSTTVCTVQRHATYKKSFSLSLKSLHDVIIFICPAGAGNATYHTW